MAQANAIIRPAPAPDGPFTLTIELNGDVVAQRRALADLNAAIDLVQTIWANNTPPGTLKRLTMGFTVQDP